ncbi:co-chaperonin GroES [Cellulophaga phage phi19:3]|uniref:Chaperonin cpn10 n=1 Tax=Cellulophaga phage phi19:3 TaxID=1327971 RepID=R9ZYC4_9CAUD|nr:co-chaperonin GroES [Cellulophaga phage phi19:3]AGO47505.1 chaperonin cpn10 [Cellulophaga phage phi19:3]
MKGLNHFIVHIPEKWSQTYKTESGLELHADRRFSLRQVGNTIVKVIETPYNYDGPVKIGDTLFIDVNALSQQSYVIGGELENQHLIDREKKLYKIDSSLIFAYKETDDSEWIGFEESILCKSIKEVKVEKKPSLIYIPEDNKEKTIEGKYIVDVLNPIAESMGIKKGDTIYVEKHLFLDVRLEDKEYVRIRVRDILGLAI